jgi:hypothetical protein
MRNKDSREPGHRPPTAALRPGEFRWHCTKNPAGPAGDYPEPKYPMVRLEEARPATATVLLLAGTAVLGGYAGALGETEAATCVRNS